MQDYKISSAVLKNKIALFKIAVFDCGEDTGKSHRPLLIIFLILMDLTNRSVLFSTETKKGEVCNNDTA